MFVLPFGHINISTKLNITEAEQKLAQEVEARQFLGGAFRPNHKFFEGEVENGHFNINRIVNYRNSFNPILIGEFRETPQHTTIDIIIRFHHLALATFVVALLFAVCFFSGLPVSYGGPVNYVAFLQSFLISLRVPFLIIIVILILFNMEVQKVYGYLRRLYEEK